jgi:very-short-patch-repair endonuclease
VPIERITRNRAKALRAAMTRPEFLLWERLRLRQPREPIFRRQHPIGPYILDFFCFRARLAIEIDGQGHGMGERPTHDAARDAYLARKGIRTIRYPALDVMADPDGVAAGIFDAARALSAP